MTQKTGEKMDIKRFEFSKELGWSVSRYDRFLNCKRQYFYDYYAQFDREVPVEKILFLKKLTSKALEVGNIVHDVIRDLLRRYQKSSKELKRDKFYEYARRMTEEYCKKTFAESYYGSVLISADEVFIKIKKILDNFLDSKRFKWLSLNAKDTALQWIIEPEGYGETRIKNRKAYCKVDFLFPMGDKLYILDWKTGSPSIQKHRKQLVGYSLWANFHFNKPIKEIIPSIAYLYPEYEEKEIQVDAKTIADFGDQVIEEMDNMYSYLQDVENNIPKEKKEFPAQTNRLCAYCNYREICQARNN
ncbi:MAG: PD-(D/E)XK nuclease family protein [Elusimicrobiota bacterium]|jgi:CRISPR/Cas system-associated exonuclease Cas4 (RecB family)|nr:PD-(D/E)XK nuclease family protein [Elusimicrobiota bacterium]